MFACKIESLFASQNGFSYFLTILLKAFINQSSFEPIVFSIFDNTNQILLKLILFAAL